METTQMPAAKKQQSQLSKLQKLKLVPKNHTLSSREQSLLESLSDDEVTALASIKKKLGAGRLAKKVTKSGKFPHPDTVGF